jgi:hypothetical protein
MTRLAHLNPKVRRNVRRNLGLEHPRSGPARGIVIGLLIVTPVWTAFLIWLFV